MENRETLVALMARAMFDTACGGRVFEYSKEHRRYYEPKALAVLAEFEKGGEDGMLEERAAEASFIASNNPMGWRFADHLIHYLPAARAALEVAAEWLNERK